MKIKPYCGVNVVGTCSADLESSHGVENLSQDVANFESRVYTMLGSASEKFKERDIKEACALAIKKAEEDATKSCKKIGGTTSPGETSIYLDIGTCVGKARIFCTADLVMTTL